MPRPAGLSLGIQVPQQQEDQSYRVDHAGNFIHGNVTITNSGLHMTNTNTLLSNTNSNNPEPLASPTIHSFETNIKIEDLRILEKLGEGACSVVYRAQHIPTNTFYAIKQINIGDKSKRHQILKELHALHDSNEQYLISFHGAFFKDNQISLILELMDLGSLSDFLSIVDGHRLGEQVLKYFALQLVSGLQYLKTKHQIHRDIKPSNCCLNSRGLIKYSDFGITKSLDNSMDQADTFVGTSSYMSGERIMGEKYSYSADVWSFGLVLLEAAIGKFPYPDTNVYIETMTAIVQGPVPTVPESLKFSSSFSNFIAKCLVKDPNQRAQPSELLQHEWLTTKSKLSTLDIQTFLKPYHDQIATKQQYQSEAVADARDDIENAFGHLQTN